jgi:hypothetical protein
VAHRGLANPDPDRGPRDAPLPEQGIEMNKQIQVDTTKIDSINAHYRSHRFDR